MRNDIFVMILHEIKAYHIMLDNLSIPFFIIPYVYIFCIFIDYQEAVLDEMILVHVLFRCVFNNTR